MSLNFKKKENPKNFNQFCDIFQQFYAEMSGFKELLGNFKKG